MLDVIFDRTAAQLIAGRQASLADKIKPFVSV